MTTLPFAFTPREFAGILDMLTIGVDHPALSARALTPAGRAIVLKAAAYTDGYQNDPTRSAWTVPGGPFTPPNVTEFNVQEVGDAISAAALIACDPDFCANLTLEGQAIALKTRACQVPGTVWTLTAA